MRNRINYTIDPEIEEFINEKSRSQKITKSEFLNKYLKKMIDYEEDLYFYNLAKSRENDESIGFEELLSSFGLKLEDLND